MLPSFHLSPFLKKSSKPSDSFISLTYPIKGYLIDLSSYRAIHSKKTIYNIARNSRLAHSAGIHSSISLLTPQQLNLSDISHLDRQFYSRDSLLASTSRILHVLFKRSSFSSLIKYVTTFASPYLLRLFDDRNSLLCGLLFMSEDTIYVYALNPLCLPTKNISLVQHAINTIVQYGLDNGFKTVDLLVGTSQYKSTFATSGYYIIFDLPQSIPSLIYFPNILFFFYCFVSNLPIL